MLRDVVIRYVKVELLRIRSRHRHHCQLALPRLTQPPLLREFLHEARAFTFRIAPLQRGPGVQREDQDGREQDSRDDQLALAGELELDVEVHEAESTSYVSVR